LFNHNIPLDDFAVLMARLGEECHVHFREFAGINKLF